MSFRKNSTHILVIDDEPAFFLIVKNIFVERGVQCHPAKTEIEARKKWISRSFDCIIIDLAMDEPRFTVNRQIFCKEVRNSNSTIPIVAVTGKPMSPVDGFRLAGFNIDAFFLKQEMNIYEFREKIEKLIIEYSTSLQKVRVPVFLPLKDEDKPSIFICYSHKNKNWLNYILEVLEPYSAAGIMTYWVDTEIEDGKNWENAIQEAIKYSDVALLLLSNSFLSSKFILSVELPFILAQNKSGILDIIWFCIESCPYHLIEGLSSIQSAHPPDDPLNKYNPSKRKSVLVSICKNIASIIEK
jgi:CheY-like chemotaxis protein